MSIKQKFEHSTIKEINTFLADINIFLEDENKRINHLYYEKFLPITQELATDIEKNANRYLKAKDQLQVNLRK